MSLQKKKKIKKKRKKTPISSFFYGRSSSTGQHLAVYFKVIQLKNLRCFYFLVKSSKISEDRVLTKALNGY